MIENLWKLLIFCLKLVDSMLNYIVSCLVVESLLYTKEPLFHQPYFKKSFVVGTSARSVVSLNFNLI
jgi:hypothetical protein